MPRDVHDLSVVRLQPGVRALAATLFDVEVTGVLDESRLAVLEASGVQLFAVNGQSAAPLGSRPAADSIVPIVQSPSPNSSVIVRVEFLRTRFIPDAITTSDMTATITTSIMTAVTGMTIVMIVTVMMMTVVAPKRGEGHKRKSQIVHITGIVVGVIVRIL
jgi:hypothetical protein